MARERDQFERGQDHWKSQYEQLKIETNAKLKANEESLHAFYLNQMEQIFDEKVKGIQKHVDTWEKQLIKEKNDALVSLEGQHNQQIESFKRQFSQLEAQIMASEAIHIASKKEAVALKGQLEQGPRSLRTTCRTSSTSASENDDIGLTSRRSLPNSNNLNNRKGSRKLSTSRMTSVTSVLQLKNDLKDEVRPRSAGPNLGSTSKTNHLDVETPSISINSQPETTFADEQTDHSAGTALLTSSEKKDLVKSFLKQFLEEHPDAVLDSQLMAGLSEKANKLIDRSFHYLD